MKWSYTEKQMRKKEKQNTTFRDYILASKNFLAIILVCKSLSWQDVTTTAKF
jgi:hypothetical protein